MVTAVPGPWVELCLSAPRFELYVRTAGGRAQGLALYDWNGRMSAAILRDLGWIEVGLRNVYDRALSAAVPDGQHWTEVLELFDTVGKRAEDRTRYDANDRPRKQIKTAISRAGRANTGKILTELPFGFWLYLSSSAHEVPLWRPYLYRGFQRGTSRRALHSRVQRLHAIRNRVAHHEHLLTTDLAARYTDLQTVARMISPGFAAHIDHTSIWLDVLSQRPI